MARALQERLNEIESDPNYLKVQKQMRDSMKQVINIVCSRSIAGKQKVEQIRRLLDVE